MNHEQVATEFYNDLAIIKETTLKRLSLEYIRERKKLSVHPGNDYPKVYSIRTKAKNNWLIFMRKTPSAEKLSHMADIAFCCVVYYQDKVGLVALRTFEKANMIEAFWGHLFHRYSERLGLNMASTVEIIKRFFNNNGYQYYDMVDTAGGRRSISICKEGFVFGKVENNGGWLINKTFINKDLAHDHQNDLEASMVAELKQDRFKQLAATYFDVAAYENLCDTLIELTANPEPMPTPALHFSAITSSGVSLPSPANLCKILTQQSTCVFKRKSSWSKSIIN